MISRNARHPADRMTLVRQLWVSSIVRNALPFLISFLVLPIFQVPAWSYLLIVASLLGGAALWAAGFVYRPRSAKPGGRSRSMTPLRKYPLRSSRQPLGLFVGRNEEIQRAADFLLQPVFDGPRVVMLFGEPGIGKTALALRIAQQVSQRYADGQVLVDGSLLNTSHGAEQTPNISTLVEALGGRSPSSPADHGELARRLTDLTSGRSILLIIDDVTRVKDVVFLLDHAPSCGFIATSRSQLTLPGSVLQCSVDPLPEGNATELLGNLIGHERVAREEEAARRIVASTAGRPLALHLVAASLASEPYAGLSLAVDRLSGSAAQESGENQLTAFDLILLSLTDEERDAVSGLGLLDKPVFPLWELQALLEVSDTTVGRITENLVRAGLIEQLDFDAAESSRFRVHDMVLACARGLVEREMSPIESTRRRAALTGAGRRRKIGHELFSVEAEVLARLGSGELAEAVECAQDAIAVGRESRDSNRVAIALTALADVHCELGNLQEARELALSALGHKVEPPAERRARRCLSKVHWRMRQFADAEVELRRALAIAIDGDDAETDRELQDLAILQVDTTGIDDALNTAERATELCGALENPTSVSSFGVLLAHGYVLRRARKPLEAKEILTVARRAAENKRQLLWSAWIDHEIGYCMFENDAPDEAEQHAVSSIGAFARMQHRYGVVHGRLLLGRIYTGAGRDFDAATVLAIALMSAQRCGDTWMEADLARIVAGVRSRENRSADAHRLYGQAASGFAEVADTPSLALVLREWNESGRLGLKRRAADWRDRLRSA